MSGVPTRVDFLFFSSLLFHRFSPTSKVQNFHELTTGQHGFGYTGCSSHQVIPKVCVSPSPFLCCCSYRLFSSSQALPNIWRNSSSVSTPLNSATCIQSSSIKSTLTAHDSPNSSILHQHSGDEMKHMCNSRISSPTSHSDTGHLTLTTTTFRYIFHAENQIGRFRPSSRSAISCLPFPW